MGEDPDDYFERQQQILFKLGITPVAGASKEEKLSMHLHHTLKTKLNENAKMLG